MLFNYSRLTPSKQNAFFGIVKVYLLKSNQLLTYLCQNQIFNIYVEISHNCQVFIFTQTLLITSFISSKNDLIFPVDEGLCISKQIHFFFQIVNSEQIHPLQLGSYFFTLLRIKPFLTNSISPPPCLCLSLMIKMESSYIYSLTRHLTFPVFYWNSGFLNFFLVENSFLKIHV